MMRSRLSGDLRVGRHCLLGLSSMLMLVLLARHHGYALISYQENALSLPSRLFHRITPTQVGEACVAPPGAVRNDGQPVQTGGEVRQS